MNNMRKRISALEQWQKEQENELIKDNLQKIKEQEIGHGDGTI